MKIYRIRVAREMITSFDVWSDNEAGAREQASRLADDFTWVPNASPEILEVYEILDEEEEDSDEDEEE